MSINVTDEERSKARKRVDNLDKVVPTWQPEDEEALELAEVLELKDVGQDSPLLKLESNPEIYGDLTMVDQNGNEKVPEDDIFAVWLNTLLQKEAFKAGVKEGDRIGIKFSGKKTSAKSGREYKDFSLTVHSRSENGKPLFEENPLEEDIPF